MKYLLLLISSVIFAQQIKSVDFKSAHAQLSINPAEKSISGNVIYSFTILKPIDTIKIDAHNMTFFDVKLNQEKVQFKNNGKQLVLIYPFKKGNNSLTFNYQANPKQTLYFIGSEESANLQVWTQGQGKYTSHWFPSFDDVNEKVVFSLEVQFDSKYQVISNGILSSKREKDNSTYWQYKMQKPMSSYLLMLAVGKFDKKIEIAKSGTPLEMYFEPNFVSNVETTYSHSKKIFDFLEDEIGVPYPWKIYKQIPVRDFLYAGMENTSATVFSNRYVVDTIGFQDRNYINVNAHELAHQWFGDLVTAESSTHHWLQEGFATYYALLAEKEIFGEDYFYFKLYDYARDLQEASKKDTIPILNSKASSLTFYQKGAWALHVLREEIGEKTFKNAVKNYVNKYSYQTVNTQNFFEEIKKLSEYDLDSFSKVWLEKSGFNSQIANNLILKNKSLQTLFEIEKLSNTPLSDKKDFFKKVLQSDVYFAVKKAVIMQLTKEKYQDKKELLQLALDTNNIQIRQAVASTINVIPEDFRVEYESFLNDKSYQTQEIALYTLWQDFPNKQSDYLEKTKNWVGFNDYNLRILWLFLAIATPNYYINKNSLIEELKNYASIKYESSTRQDALEKLLNLNIVDNIVLKNLIKATTHHQWQFAKFGREAIRNLFKQNQAISELENISATLNDNEKVQLNRLLNN